MDPANPTEPVPVQDGLSLLRQDLDAAIAAFSLDRDVRPSLEEQAADVEGLPSLQQEVGLGDIADPLVQRAVSTLYGQDFPLLEREPRDDAWAAWAGSLWKRHAPGVQTRLHVVERNRLFRRGVQWISAIGLGPWREPPKPREAARVVDNMIRPALDQRIEIVSEQRPGFKARPENQDQRNLKKAEAQQVALEYQYDQQKMRSVIKEATYWNGTDAVSFLESYWDTEAGPWDELFTAESEQPDASGAIPMQGQRQPLGDAKTRVRRIEQVRVSSNSTANNKPFYWIIRDPISAAQAVRDYGVDVLTGEGDLEKDHVVAGIDGTRLGYQTPNIDELLRDQETVDRYTVYCDRSEYLKGGLTLVVVGKKVVVGPMPLMFGVVPMVRWADGSSDPSFFPEAIMEDWIDSQMRVNALKSKWVESIRLNAGGKIIGREGSLAGETLVGGSMTMVGFKGGGNIQDAVMPFPSFSIGADVKDLLEIEKKVFEDKSGWNDTSRGSFSSDQSGRAILAIREQLERVFAPSINAAADAMTDWAKIQIAIMKWGYDLPRMLSVEGSGRPDLAREVNSDDFDGIANVLIDPETLMPLPRALRQFLLDDMLAKGLMSPQEYRKRMPFAFVQNIDTPDTDHYARAKRAAECLRKTVEMMMPNANPPECPILWQDNEAIHQDVLERELILPDDLPPELRGIAYERWMMYAQQSAMKGTGAVPATPGGQQQPGQGKPPQLPAGQQPMQGTNPGMAAGAKSDLKAGDTANAGAKQADAMSHI